MDKSLISGSMVLLVLELPEDGVKPETMEAYPAPVGEQIR